MDQILMWFTNLPIILLNIRLKSDFEDWKSKYDKVRKNKKKKGKSVSLS